MKVYISGPVRGIALYNFPAFDAAETSLLTAGCEVISPARMDRGKGFNPEDLPEDFDWLELPQGMDLLQTVQRDIEAVLECDAIHCLDGWRGSTGATAEVAVARFAKLTTVDAHGVPVSLPEPVTEEATKLTHGARIRTYDHPRDDFSRTAGFWKQILNVDVTPEQIALCMMAVKLSRLCNGYHRDSAVDMGGYAETLARIAENR